MTDKEIFQLWQDNIQKKVAEIDKAIELLIQLRDSYTVSSWPGGLKKREEFVPETWRE
jgi:flagellin-specific chaperone FliS